MWVRRMAGSARQGWPARTARKWIAARPAAQRDLFDERNLFELAHPDFPGERACRKLAEYRRKKPDKLWEMAASQLDEVRGMVARGRLKSRVGLWKIFNKHKVAKRFRLKDRQFNFSISQAKINVEAAFDGGVGVPSAHLYAPDTVRRRLCEVEPAFRSTIDLKIRPVSHLLETRVRAHIFPYAFCMQHRMACRPLLFTGKDRQAEETRDSAAPAQRPANAMRKAHASGSPLRSAGR